METKTVEKNVAVDRSHFLYRLFCCTLFLSLFVISMLLIMVMLFIFSEVHEKYELLAFFVMIILIIIFLYIAWISAWAYQKNYTEVMEKIKARFPSLQTSRKKFRVATNMQPSEVRCPKCSSTQITANKAGFSVGKAALGGMLIGPWGLLGGVLGKNKILVTCLKCGNQCKAGS